MSFSSIIESLKIGSMIAFLKGVMRTFPDLRTGDNCVYSIEDAAVAAFSVFYLQSPSFLDYQKVMESDHNRSNAQSLFGLEKIPTDNCIRKLLDPVEPSLLDPMFAHIFTSLHQGGYLEPYRFPLGNSSADINDFVRPEKSHTFLLYMLLWRFI